MTESNGLYVSNLIRLMLGKGNLNNRVQIVTSVMITLLKHTLGLREASDNLDELASRTKNFSGAEIEGLVKSAASYAFYRCVCVCVCVEAQGQ